MAIGPVCEMVMDESRLAAMSVYRRNTCLFCTTGCEFPYVKNPEKYFSK